MLQANKEKMKNLINLLAIDEDSGYRKSIEKLRKDLNFSPHEVGNQTTSESLNSARQNAYAKNKSTVASSGPIQTDFIYTRKLKDIANSDKL